MIKEAELDTEQMNEKMKYDLLLAHPEAYKEMYPAEADPAGADAGYGWAIPESEADVQKILEDIKRLGVMD